MNDDVILSRAEAKNLADFLRRRGIGEHHSLLKRLDPPQPSLRDEVASELGDTSWAGETADRVLAVVRKHIGRQRVAQPQHGGDPGTWSLGYASCRDAVLALFGGTDE